MHHFKNELSSSNSNTILETQTFTNIQKCLRLNDLDSIDDLNDRTHNIPIQVLHFYRNNELKYESEVKNIFNYYQIKFEQ